GGGGNHCLGALTLEAPCDAVDIQCRPGPDAFEDAAALFAYPVLHPDLIQEAGAVEGYGVQLFQFLGTEFGDVVVEPRNGDTTIGVVQLADHLRQYVDGVRDGAAVGAGV